MSDGVPPPPPAEWPQAPVATAPGKVHTRFCRCSVMGVTRVAPAAAAALTVASKLLGAVGDARQDGGHEDAAGDAGIVQHLHDLQARALSNCSGR